jgi:hypothetical protein
LLHIANNDNVINKSKSNNTMTGTVFTTLTPSDGMLLNWDRRAIMTENGNFAASVRLYGHRYSGSDTRVGAYYVYLVKVARDGNGNWTSGTVVDAAEINIVFIANSTGTSNVVLGGVFEAGDEMGIVMFKYDSAPEWELYAWGGDNRMISDSKVNMDQAYAQPVRTSFIWWKL